MSALGGDFRLLMPFFAVVLLHIAATWAVAQSFGLAQFHRLSLYHQAIGVSIYLAVPVWFVVYFGAMIAIDRERRPLSRVAGDIRTYVLNPGNLAGAALPMLAIPYLMSSFSSFKSMIPQIIPFYADPVLAEVDAVLHFGIDPWRITHTLLSSEWATLLINIAYNAWLFVVWIFLFCHIFWLTGRRHRARYLLGFALTWTVIGSLSALLLSSAGPCYFDQVTDLDDPFAPLMERLAAQDEALQMAGAPPLWALSTQEMLWDHYAGTTTAAGGGISAMPSMHIAMAVLMALSAWKIGRPFGWLMWSYAGVIMIGSIHLGWHYAIDGYAAALLAILIWRVSGRVVERIQLEKPIECTPNPSPCT